MLAVQPSDPLGISVGALFLLLAFIEILYVLSFWVTGTQATLAPGWSSLMFVILCVGGFLMINLGVIGAYSGYIYQEVKRRPIYLIRSEHPFEDATDEKRGEHTHE